MGQRYWVIGGEFSDCRFKDLKPGTDRCAATERYSICVEPVLQ